MHFKINTEGYILSTCDSTPKFLGFQPGQLTGTSIFEIVHNSHHAKVVSTLDQLIHNQLPNSQWQGELLIMKRSQESILTETSFLQLERGDILVLSKDITKRKNREDEQHRLQLDLARVKQEMAELTYVTSHDLKSPLRAISSLTSWLKDDYEQILDERGKRQLGLLMDRAQRMDQFLDGILAYVKAARVLHQRELVDSHQVASDIKHRYERTHPQVQIVLASHLPIIFYPKTLLQQVFEIIIDNAIRYNNHCRKRVVVGHEEGEAFITFYISDNGRGIDARYHQKIFKLFQTLDSKDESGSLGIGLSIARKMVETNGGEIWLDSSKGEGTKVFFTTKLPKG